MFSTFSLGFKHILSSSFVVVNKLLMQSEFLKMTFIIANSFLLDLKLRYFMKFPIKPQIMSLFSFLLM